MKKNVVVTICVIFLVGTLIGLPNSQVARTNNFEIVQQFANPHNLGYFSQNNLSNFSGVINSLEYSRGIYGPDDTSG